MAGSPYLKHRLSDIEDLSHLPPQTGSKFRKKNLVFQISQFSEFYVKFAPNNQTGNLHSQPSVRSKFNIKIRNLQKFEFYWKFWLQFGGVSKSNFFGPEIFSINQISKMTRKNVVRMKLGRISLNFQDIWGTLMHILEIKKFSLFS